MLGQYPVKGKLEGEEIILSTNPDSVEKAGTRSVTWNASSLPSGVYFYRLDAIPIADPGKVYSKVLKMMVMK